MIPTLRDWRARVERDGFTVLPEVYPTDRTHEIRQELAAALAQKAGVPHAEAPLEILEEMLTARVHLDAMTEANGPLQVVPGSHHTGKAMPAGDVPPRTILGNAGDVLLMRPLLAHASGRSHPETR